MLLFVQEWMTIKKFMKILLVTTLPNLVYRELLKDDNVSIDLIDIGESSMDKNQFLSVLDSNVYLNDYQLLITYRCPYYIPDNIREKIGKCINIHPLSLPMYKGLNPWKKFLDSGEHQSEAVVHLMTDAFDSGEIIARWPYTFDNPDDARGVSDSIISKNLPQFIRQYDMDAYR